MNYEILIFQKVRKWTTKFLNILIGLGDLVEDNISSTKTFDSNLNDNIFFGAKYHRMSTTKSKGLDEYTMRLVVRQLSDESPKVVRNAVQVLLNWLPVFFYINLMQL